jgi:hypothetical protein
MFRILWKDSSSEGSSSEDSSRSSFFLVTALPMDSAQTKIGATATAAQAAS